MSATARPPPRSCSKWRATRRSAKPSPRSARTSPSQILSNSVWPVIHVPSLPPPPPTKRRELAAGLFADHVAEQYPLLALKGGEPHLLDRIEICGAGAN